MKTVKLFFVLIAIALLTGCQKENPVEPNASSSSSSVLYYKIEHEEGAYPYPVDPAGVVTEDQGYKYGIPTGETVYIKNNTELDFWFEPNIQKATWTLEEVGHGGSIVNSTSTLKTSYIVQGEYHLTVNLPTSVYRIIILVKE